MVQKFLDKIPTDKLYEDLFQPSLKRAGEALATVIDLSNSILLPIKLLNEKSRIVFQNNMKKYQEKLEKVNPDNLTQVPEYVGLPILDKLTYLSETNISEAFINLLTKASVNKTLSLVHPSFLTVLNDLSSDDAKILFSYKTGKAIPFIDIFIVRELIKIPKPENKSQNPITRENLNKLIDYTFQDKETTDIKISLNLTGIEKLVSLDFPENIEMYIYNLEKHNIIEFERNGYTKNDISQLELLEHSIYKDLISGIKNEIDIISSKPENQYSLRLEIRRGTISFTSYGLAFLKACMNEITLKE